MCIYLIWIKMFPIENTPWFENARSVQLSVARKAKLGVLGAVTAWNLLGTEPGGWKFLGANVRLKCQPWQRMGASLEGTQGLSKFWMAEEPTHSCRDASPPFAHGLSGPWCICCMETEADAGIESVRITQGAKSIFCGPRQFSYTNRIFYFWRQLCMTWMTDMLSLWRKQSAQSVFLLWAANLRWSSADESKKELF